jgi:S-adenosylmethionine decarboxylase
MACENALLADAGCVSRPAFAGEDPMPFGYHLMIDMYECEGEALSSLSLTYEFLEKLAEALKMTKQSPPFLFRSDEKAFPAKAGLSGWLPLIESGIQIHTIEPARFVSLDVYSCRNFDQTPIVDFARQVFKPSEVEHEFIHRGKKYPTVTQGAP